MLQLYNEVHRFYQFIWFLLIFIFNVTEVTWALQWSIVMTKTIAAAIYYMCGRKDMVRQCLPHNLANYGRYVEQKSLSPVLGIHL